MSFFLAFLTLDSLFIFFVSSVVSPSFISYINAKISDAQISDVSQLTLSQETTEILEFNVSFKSNQPTLSNEDIPTNINLSSDKAYSNEYKNAGSNFFSNLLKNGLSAAQNAVVDTFDNLLTSWK